MFKYDIDMYLLRKIEITCLYQQQQHKEKDGTKEEERGGGKTDVKPQKNLLQPDT